MQNYLKVILRGVGQVMLQNNALTGLLFLVGIFYHSWLFGLGAIMGNVVSTIAAIFLGGSEKDIEDGLYGFNGTLVGIAVVFFFVPSVVTILAILLGSILSTIVMKFMKEKVPVFTAPFVIATWIVIVIITFFGLAAFVPSSPLQDSYLGPLSAISMGLGQVMFQGNIITGILFFIAILVSSRTAAIYALYGSLLGGLIALLFSLPFSMINIGLFGYNAVLCGIALGGKKWSSFFLATFGIGLSVILNFSMGKVGIITLTAPFVIATWIALLVKNYIVKM